jgi:hypothetical protein
MAKNSMQPQACLKKAETHSLGPKYALISEFALQLRFFDAAGYPPA